MDIKTALELIPQIPELLDIGKSVVALSAASAKEPIEQFTQWHREQMLKSILFYEAAGFTRDQAIATSLGEQANLLQAIQNGCKQGK